MLLQSRTGETAIKTQHRCSFNDKSVRFTQIQRFQGKHPPKTKRGSFDGASEWIGRNYLSYSDVFEELFFAFVAVAFDATVFLATGFLATVFFPAVVFATDFFAVASETSFTSTASVVSACSVAAKTDPVASVVSSAFFEPIPKISGVKRPLMRLTLFSCQTPCLPALSTTDIKAFAAALIASASPLSFNASNFLEAVLMRLFPALFRNVRFAILRIDFFEDLMFAIIFRQLNRYRRRCTPLVNVLLAFF